MIEDLIELGKVKASLAMIFGDSIHQQCYDGYILSNPVVIIEDPVYPNTPDECLFRVLSLRDEIEDTSIDLQLQQDYTQYDSELSCDLYEAHMATIVDAYDNINDIETAIDARMIQQC